MPNVTGAWFVGRGKFKVDLERSTTPVDPGTEGSVEETSLIWTIHPKRRMSAALDQKRKRPKFRGLSMNTDSRPWRRTLVYRTRKIIASTIQTLCQWWAGKTYAQLEADPSTMTYADIPDSECTYADLEVM